MRNIWGTTGAFLLTVVLAITLMTLMHFGIPGQARGIVASIFLVAIFGLFFLGQRKATDREAHAGNYWSVVGGIMAFTVIPSLIQFQGEKDSLGPNVRPALERVYWANALRTGKIQDEEFEVKYKELEGIGPSASDIRGLLRRHPKEFAVISGMESRKVLANDDNLEFLAGQFGAKVATAKARQLEALAPVAWARLDNPPK
jgi:hypothetical protein